MIGRKMPLGPIRARELARLKEEMLRDDPEYRAKVEAVEAERQERFRRLGEAEQPVVSDLRGAGVEAESVWKLVNTSEPYPNALPVLMDHLEGGGYPGRVMESLGRALAVKPSVAFWDRLKGPADDLEGGFTQRLVHPLAPGAFGRAVPCDLSLDLLPGGGVLDRLRFPGGEDDEDLFAADQVEVAESTDDD